MPSLTGKACAAILGVWTSNHHPQVYQVAIGTPPPHVCVCCCSRCSTRCVSSKLASTRPRKTRPNRLRLTRLLHHHAQPRRRVAARSVDKRAIRERRASLSHLSRLTRLCQCVPTPVLSVKLPSRLTYPMRCPSFVRSRGKCHPSHPSSPSTSIIPCVARTAKPLSTTPAAPLVRRLVVLARATALCALFRGEYHLSECDVSTLSLHFCIIVKLLTHDTTISSDFARRTFQI